MAVMAGIDAWKQRAIRPWQSGYTPISPGGESMVTHNPLSLTPGTGVPATPVQSTSYSSLTSTTETSDPETGYQTPDSSSQEISGMRSARTSRVCTALKSCAPAFFAVKTFITKTSIPAQSCGMAQALFPLIGHALFELDEETLSTVAHTGGAILGAVASAAVLRPKP